MAGVLNDRIRAVASSHLYRVASQSIWLAIIIRKKYHATTFTETFQKAKGRDMIFFVGARNIVDQLLCHSVFVDNYVMYTHELPSPLFETDLPSTDWLMSAMVVPFLASLLRTKFMDINVYMYIQFRNGTTLHELLNWKWLDTKDIVLEQLKMLMEHSNRWLCTNCTSECEFHKYSWHWKLHQFRQEEFTPQPHTFMEDSVDFLRGTYSSKWSNSNFMDSLKRLWQERHLGTTLTEMDDVITHHALECKKKFFCTYFVVIVDGHNMADYVGKDLRFLLGRKDVVKALYAGMTTNMDGIRKRHFMSQLSLFGQVLTLTSRVFLIRKRRFLTKLLAEIDEAKLIFLCSLLKRLTIEATEISPYALFNKNMESANLFKLSPEDKAEIYAFIDSGTPILWTPGQNITDHQSDWLTGNFKVGEDKSSSVKSIKTFVDVESIYHKYMYNLKK